MPKPIKRSSPVGIPWLIIFSSIIAPVFGIASGVDVFYFGLPIASVISFSSSTAIAFTLIWVFLAYKPRFLNKITVAGASMTLAVAISNFLGEMTRNAGVIIKPLMGVVANHEYFFYALGGAITGVLIGLGCEKWSRNLVEAGFQTWLAFTLPLMTFALVFSSTISGVLQIFDVCLILAVAAASIPIAVKLLDQLCLRIRRK